jgi:hypothetical protein
MIPAHIMQKAERLHERLYRTKEGVIYLECIPTQKVEINILAQALNATRLAGINESIKLPGDWYVERLFCYPTGWFVSAQTNSYDDHFTPSGLIQVQEKETLADAIEEIKQRIRSLATPTEETE